jgi:gliding motility-associated-like protein
MSFSSRAREIVRSDGGGANGGLANDTIYSAQTICYNTIPLALTGTVPTGGVGAYTYKWLSSTTSATTGYAVIGGATAQGYAPAALTATRWYIRVVTSGIFTDTTAPVQITVTPVISHASNTIASAQTICFNTAPAILTGSTPTGGNGTFTYYWQSAPDNATWTTIPGVVGVNDTVPVLTATTYYRRVASSGNCTDITTSVKITVNPVITNDTIKTAQSICSGQTPLALTGTTPIGGSGSFIYLWQSSTVSATSGFATASGTTNGSGYAPGSLTQTTWFRRVVTSGGCSDTTVPVQVTVVTAAPGNPTVFGDNVWNAYVYSDNAFGTYAGYYTEPNLSFATTNRYTTTQSPSSASGYQGCLVGTTNFSVSMKRTDFPPGDYQLNLTQLDDNLVVLVNGVQVYTRNCCTAPAAPVNNIWTGYLGVSDQVELRWTQLTGGSYLGLNFVPVTPAAINPGTIGSNQQVCYGDGAAAAFTNTASPTSGCTLTGYQWQSSVDSVVWNNISGATALTYSVPYAMTQTTWYRRVTTDACNTSAVSLPVKITVNVIPPGDPTAFGNGVWNCDAYQFPSSNTNFSAASYKGYYTEPLLSFVSTNRWPSGGSPSVASGYQGCYVAGTYNWMCYKRTNFTPGVYQIDIPSHDDWCYLYINGVLVFQHLSCCDSHTNVWTGPLGANDQVEFRVEQFAGGSNGAITLTPVTPTPLVAGTISSSQTTCAGSVPPYPMTQTVAPTGGCTILTYQWQVSTDGTTWVNVSGANTSSYTITNSVYQQTLYREVAIDYCGDSAYSQPDTVYMNNSAPGDPTQYGNNIWNVYCFQDVNYSIYAGYYTEPNLTFATTSRYPSTSPPSTASGYQGCQLINTYYSVSMKRTGFTAGTYQIDVTADDDYVSVYINGVLVSSLTYPTIQNNIWTGALAPTDQIEVRWRNNAGPGQSGLRFTLVTPTALVGGLIKAYNPGLCTGDLPQSQDSVLASGGCYVNYYWQSSVDGGTTWTTIAGYSGNADTNYTASVSPSVPTTYRRVAADICGDTAYSNAVTFTPGAGAVGNPAVYGNGVWNAYCYNANGTPFSAATYMGYYTEPLLSFNSANRWSTSVSPSTASGYQGCQVDQINNWVSYRRTNIPAGTYQLNIPYHDDDVYVFINGVQVWYQSGCCVADTNVWTGTLGATDQVEFRWRQYYGASQGALTFVPVPPATGVVPGSIGSNQTICANTAPSALTSTTSGSSTCYVTYQWQAQTNCTGAWTSISGATGLTYTPGTLTSPTCFRRMASDACGNTAYSNTATVSFYSTTLAPGTIASAQTICNGSTPAALSSTGRPSGGDGNYVYQWQSSPDGVAWTNISGAVSAGYSPGILTASTYYRRTVTACGTASTGATTALLITVNQPPVITTQPTNPTACSGGNTSVTVAATGTALTYQWQVFNGTSWANAVNGAVYSGVTTTTMTITNVTAAMNNYQYRVIVSGSCPAPVTSNQVVLTTGTAPTIGTQPVNTTTCVGSATTIGVTASGSGLTYQWQQKVGSGVWTNLVDGGVYSGSLTTALTLTGVTAAMNNYSYQCIVNTSCGGTVTSSVAVLTVVAAISNAITADQTVCSGLNAAYITGPASGSYTYLWQTSTVSTSSGFVTASGTNNIYYYNPNPVSTTTYYRRLVSNTGCSSVSNAVTVTVNPTAIAVTTQPANQAICAGGTAVFSVNVSGPATLTYQWYEYAGSTWNPITDGGIYSGSATATLTLTGATAAMNNYRYYVKIASSGCTASTTNSNSAGLTTSNAPNITANSASVTTCSGATANFSVTATGIGLTYQWQANTGSGWNNLSNFGAYTNVNTYVLTVTPVAVAMSGYQFRCIVTGSCTPTTATSTPVTLTVNPPLSNNSVSSSQNLCAGTPNPFTVTTPTGGDGAYVYQWYQNTGSGYVTISGANSSNYTVGPLTATTSYIRQVTDGACAYNNSIGVTITINPSTSISSNPSSMTVCAGTNALFSVGATGTGVSYQWQVNTGSGFGNIANGAQYTGVATANLTVVKPAYSMNGYQYQCIVSGNCAPATALSTAATLTVNPVATVTMQPANVSSCSGSTVTFSVGATGGAVGYQWMQKVSPGVFSAISNGGVYSGATTSTLTLTGITTAMNTYQYLCVLTLGSCPINSDSASLTVNAQPILVITNPAAVCAPGTVDITAAAVTAGSSTYGGTLTYWKDAAATMPLSGPNAIAVSGTYYIRVATSPVCYAIMPVTVTVNAVPALVITNPAPVCYPGTIDLTAPAVTAGSASGLAYTYFTNAGATTTLSNPNEVATSGTYYIKGTAATSCSSVAPVTATINALPVASISYAGTPYCATGVATVTQTGVSGGVYSSTAGLSINGGTGAVNLVASTAGTYTVTYAFSNGTCSNTTTTTIKINPLPVASIAYAGTPYCATGTASVTQTGVGGGSYASTAGLVINSSTGAINLVTSTAGTYTVTYSFTNGTCSNTATTSVTINALPVAAISYAGTPYCATGTATVTQTGLSGGVYSSTAGLSLNSSTGAINLAASTAGTYTVSYAFSNGTCSQTTTTSVTINAMPVASLAYAGTPYCATGTAAVTQTGVVGGTYSSTAGLVINSSTGSVDLVASTAGTYTVSYSFTNGTCSSTTTASITIKALPVASISYAGTPYCATGTAAVTQTGQAGGVYSSTAGLSLNSSTGAINLVASTAGTYTVTYSFTNGGCSNTTTASVTINALPVASIAYAGSPYCATGTASVTQTGVGGGTYGSTAGLVIDAGTGAIDLVASTAGTYIVTYTFTNGTCSNTTTTSVTIKALPVASIAYAGSPYCAMGTATVTQTGLAGGSYSSATGLSLNSSTGAINLATSVAGTYTVTYTFNNGSCGSTATSTVVINALPVASIAYAGSPYCATGIASVTQTGAVGGTYSSTAGLVIDAGTGAVDLVASTAGTYTVTYAFTNGTCSNSTTASVVINALPVAAISYAGSPYCATGTASVTRTGVTGGSYSSTPGLVINSGTGAINLATSTAGTYTVTYSFNNGVCSNTATATVTINALPVASIAYPANPYCENGTAVVVQTGVSGGTYSSTSGLVIDAGTGTVDLGSSLAGVYTVTYSFGNGVCSNTTTASITIHALPLATVSYPASPYCTTGTAVVTITGIAGGVFGSTNGLAINSASGEIDLAACTPGTYTVSYAFSDGTCTNTTTKTVVIRNPTLVVNNPAPACSPNVVDLTAAAVTTGSAPGLTYVYYTNSSATTFVNHPDAMDAGGTYYIRGTNLSNGCMTALEPVTVTLHTPPVLTVSGNTDVCKGSPDTLVAVSPGSTIEWLNVGSGATVVVNPLVSGNYVAVATNGVGCSDTAALTVDVRPFSVTLSATPEPVLSGNTVTLTTTANFSYQVIAWLPEPAFTDQTALSQTIVVHDTATLFSVVAQSSQGCLDTAVYVVQVNANTGDFFIPNAFTPNNDGKNDVWKLYGSSIRDVEMKVFSQWGQIVFSSKDPQAGWDGNYGGKPAPVGPYVYIVKVVFTDGKSLTRKGTVSLIR